MVCAVWQINFGTPVIYQSMGHVLNQHILGRRFLQKQLFLALGLWGKNPFLTRSVRVTPATRSSVS